jgi:hypothetical protein
MIAEPLAIDSLLIEPEAGVIEDARARRRRHRQAGAAATLIAAAIAAIALATSGGGGAGIPPIVDRVASRLPGLNLAHARLAPTDTAAEYQVWILPGADSPGD